MQEPVASLRILQVQLRCGGQLHFGLRTNHLRAALMMEPSVPAKGARVEPPVAAAIAAAAAPAAPPLAAAPDGPGVVFVPLVVSSFAAVAEKMTAFMSLPAARRSLVALAHGATGETQMYMPFIPLSSLGGAPQMVPAAPPTAATAAAAAATSDDLDQLLASLLDATGANELPGSNG